ncbi:MAG: hypothetical protein K6T86_13625 [Pirellulales bacterium]|jgi:hypothetical protein|nr:hypothetical protein [Pirellulales bacterium]
MIRISSAVVGLVLILIVLAGCRAMGGHAAGGDCPACNAAAGYDTP